MPFAEKEIGLNELYEFVDKFSPLINNVECSGCHKLCARIQSYHWLLDSEAKELIEYFDINILHGANYFSDGKCSMLSSQKCLIYDKRPLECRLSPISIVSINKIPYYILDTECQLFQRQNNKEILLEEIKEFMENFISKLDDKLFLELITISNSVEILDKENEYMKKYIVLGEMQRS